MNDTTSTSETATRVPVFVRVGHDGTEYMVGTFMPAGPLEPGGTGLVLASLLHDVADTMDRTIAGRMDGAGG